MSKLHIVMYHYVRDLRHSRYPQIKGMDITFFREQINFLKNNFYIITMEEVIDKVENGENLPDNAALLTFDDGYIDHYTYVLPVLEEAKVQGSFFVSGKTFTTHQLLDVNKVHYILASVDIRKLLHDVYEKMDFYRGIEFDYPSNEELFLQYAKNNRFDIKETVFVKQMLQTVLPEHVRKCISSELFQKYVGTSEEKVAYELYMTEEQLKIMKHHGMFIGCHGYDHCRLGKLPTEIMKKDIIMSLEVMDQFIDKNHWVMNYPYGDYSEGVVQTVKDLGACIGLTVKADIADIPRYNRLILPRLDCNDYPPQSYNYRTIRECD